MLQEFHQEKDVGIHKKNGSWQDFIHISKLRNAYIETMFIYKLGRVKNLNFICTRTNNFPCVFALTNNLYCFLHQNESIWQQRVYPVLKAATHCGV